MTDEKKVSKQEKLVKVVVIKAYKDTALVELTEAGELVRYIVPLASLTDKGILPSDLELGIKYGIPWEQELKLDATVKKLASNLRKAGLWTAEDIIGNYNLVAGVLQATYGVDLGEISRIAYTYRKLEGGK